MNDAATAPAKDTRERILDAAELMLRRHGPAKTTVVDVARELKMSHANVYRHFASKAALQDAVAERWLEKITRPLESIVTRDGTAAERLEGWVLALAEFKRSKVLDDPELFAAYHAVAEAAREVVAAHLEKLQDQMTRIVASGVADGEFKVSDAGAAARAVLAATIRFHHPHHVRESGGRPNTAEIKAVVGLLLAGLKSGAI